MDLFGTSLANPRSEVGFTEPPEITVIQNLTTRNGNQQHPQPPPGPPPPLPSQGPQHQTIKITPPPPKFVTPTPVSHILLGSTGKDASSWLETTVQLQTINQMNAHLVTHCRHRVGHGAHITHCVGLSGPNRTLNCVYI